MLLDSFGFGFGFVFFGLLPSTVFAASSLSSNNCRNTFGEGLDCLLCMYVRLCDSFVDWICDWGRCGINTPPG